MGRTKQVLPVRRSSVGDAPPLGWITQPEHVSSSLLLAAELQREQQRRGVATHPIEEDFLDDHQYCSEDEEYDGDGTTSTSRKPRAATNGTSRLASIVAEIEAREKANDTRRRRNQQRSKKQRTKNKKSVSFASEEAITIPSPEVQVVQLDDEEGSSRTVLMFSPRLGNSTAADGNGSSKLWFVLKTTSLPFELIVQSKQEPSTFPLRVTTRQGAMDMWTFVVMKTQHYCGKSERTKLAIGRAVEAGTLCLEIFVNPQQPQQSKAQYAVRICLTEKAFTACDPAVIPLQSRTRRSSRYQNSNDVLSILAATATPQLFADQYQHHPSNNQLARSVVTAKQVYALTDNVQLKNALKNAKVPTEKLDVPGLVPKLRPYQEEAVRWMLQREQSSADERRLNNKEWMLAWLVVDGRCDGGARDDKPVSVPLSDWWEHQQDYEQQSNVTSRNTGYSWDNRVDFLFYCPFAGWLVKSLDEARTATLSKYGYHDNATFPTGGILAESMGLGKSVEVLACILANPRERQDDMDTERSRPQTAANARRRLDYGVDNGNESMDTAAKANPTDAVSQQTDNADSSSNKIGYVEDLSAFGDADMDSESEDEGLVPATAMGAHDGEQSPRADRGVPVTPEKVHTSEESVAARWIDDDTLGACICGRLIGFDTQSGPVVVCQNCEEPMHLRCAAFDDDDEMKRETTPVRYMQQFTNCKLDCRMCEKDRCPCCVGPKESCATLIVTPAAILNQWEREIQRHSRRDDGKPLRVVVYEGIKRLALSNTSDRGSTAMRALHPAHLARADIVLMTFDSLMTDLTHTDDNRFLQRSDSVVTENTGGSLRKRKRYRVVPSPLMNIEWWRVCLDEAQRVETPTAGSAQMALKLKACHRWCVSGTPVGRGKLEDLYGLLLFLRVEPFCDTLWFRKCFSGAILPLQIERRIQLLLSDIFWRSTKSFDLVREQMGVPEQVEKTIVLRFSSVEKHFYDRQLEKTLSAAGDLKDQELAGKKRKLSSMNLVSENLHKLRAACCHPQVGSSGIGSVKKSRSSTNRKGSGSDASVSSRVMSMTQILQTLIDDAKTQCEEAQRLAVMHNNAMAAVSKLKVEAKTLGVPIDESDHKLLLSSCKLYEQSLTMAEENAEPTLVFGETTLGGSVGFRSSQKIVHDCGFFLDWQWNETPANDSSVWSKFDFMGQGRKITQLRIRSLTEIPDDLRQETSYDFAWHLMYPKDCAFQCQSHGGEYVDVHRFSLPHPGEEAIWSVENDFRTNKSKSWRIVVKSFHPTNVVSVLENLSCGVYAGLDVELFEAAIASDPLQRLHSLHNGALSFISLVQLRQSESIADDNSELTFSSDQLHQKAESMAAEATKIELLYLGAARAKHDECRRRLDETFTARRNLEQSLLEITRTTKPNDDCVDCWDDKWWDDFLVMCRLQASETHQQVICERLLADLDGHLQGGFGTSTSTNREGAFAFPVFGNIEGLRTALSMRIRSIRTGLGIKQSQKGLSMKDLNTDFRVDRFKCASGAHEKCMQAILDLSSDPGEAEIVENSRCHVCKADWFRKGPMCRHCKINEKLEDLSVDKITRRVLQSLHAILKGNIGASIIKSSPEAMLAERANKFFDLLNAQFREIRAAFVMWRVHLDLLNDLDELNSCKSTMRLTFDEDVTQLSEEELNAVVVPVDVCARYHEHAAKQAMALGTLSRAKGTLQYLKNQSTAEHRREEANEGGTDEETCSLCLDAFDSTRAVLRCGHSFHLTPCMETLRSKSGGAQKSICCPLRCRMRTSPDGVLIASEKRHDDGSRNKRRIKGSYGTKVTRLVCDILDVCETGAKSLVFSQWDDMLDICEAALLENGIQITRVKSVRQIAKCTHAFRVSDCLVMLLNVKNGAEGLTLLEATNIFMIEPILNCGLDSQAINRVHRIGQTRKTTVWRYLVADTVEMKIDKLRREHQQDEFEDAINESKKSEFNAGGIDGGFQSADELLSLLQ